MKYGRQIEIAVLFLVFNRDEQDGQDFFSEIADLILFIMYIPVKYPAGFGYLKLSGNTGEFPDRILRPDVVE